MSDPERLSKRHPSALARSLLEGARDEEPPPSLLGRTLASVSAAAAVSTVAEAQAALSATETAGASGAGAACSGSVAGSGLFGAIAKGVGIGGVTVALATGAASELTSRSTPVPPARSAPVVIAIPPPKAAAKPSDAEPERTVSPDDLPLLDAPSSPRPASTARTSEPRTDTQLEEEARLIDRAREAVTAGNSGLALRELDAHGARFARPVFRPEALYLRMQALRLNGNEEAARQIARRLLTAYPNGPQAAAARAFLKTSEP